MTGSSSAFRLLERLYLAAVHPAFAYVLLLLVLPRYFAAAQSQYSTVNVYWNSSTFQRYNSTSNYVIQANLNDQLAVVCPYSASNPEYYYIYYTSQASVVRSCNLSADPNAFQWIQCVNQQSVPPFTFTLSPFNPIYSALVFQPGHTYYLVSTSTMQQSGIGNTVGGACASVGSYVTLSITCCPADYSSLDYTPTTVASVSTSCCQSGVPLVSTRSGSRSRFVASSQSLSLASLILVFASIAR